MSEKGNKKEKHFIRPWGYVGYNILFCIPVIGLILNIIFCFSKHRNKRYYARSFWCHVLLSLIILAVIAASGLIFFKLTDTGKTVWTELQETQREVSLVVVRHCNNISQILTGKTPEPQVDTQATAVPVSDETETGTETETDTETKAAAVEPSEGAAALVGEWEYEGGRYTYLFNEDGTGTYTVGETVMAFTYEATDTELSILYDGNTSPFKTTYEVDGDRLNIRDSFGSDTIYVKKAAK